MDENNLKSVRSVWGINNADAMLIEAEAEKFELKHGMFASVPLICRGKKCPYSETCRIPESVRVVNDRCHIEIGAILSRFDSWCRHFDIDTSGSKIDDKDLVDVMLIRDLIDIEIQIIRAENKLAITGDFIGKELAEVDKQGNPWYNQTVTPEAEYKLTLLDKRQKILNQLNATRKDKANSNKNSSEGAVNAAFEKVKEALKNKKIDLDNLGDDY